MYDVITLINLQVSRKREKEREEKKERERDEKKGRGKERSSVTKTMFSPLCYPSCGEF